MMSTHNYLKFNDLKASQGTSPRLPNFLDWDPTGYSLKDIWDILAELVKGIGQIWVVRKVNSFIMHDQFFLLNLITSLIDKAQETLELLKKDCYDWVLASIPIVTRKS